MEQQRVRQAEAKIPAAEEEYSLFADQTASAQAWADEAGRYLNELQCQR